MIATVVHTVVKPKLEATNLHLLTINSNISVCWNFLQMSQIINNFFIFFNNKNSPLAIVHFIMLNLVNL